MNDLDPRRVSADTTEISYTGKGGRQVSIPITRKGRYAYATPATADDAATLDGLGFTAIARKAGDEANEAEAATDAPESGEQEG